MKNLICTSCIQNTGLRFLAEKLSEANDNHFFETCGHTCKFLDEENVEQLVSEFFVYGSVPPSLGGYAPVYNIKSTGVNELTFESELDQDITLLSQYKSLPLYHYGPPLYKIGATTNYQDLVYDKVTGQRRSEIWEEIIGACKCLTLQPGAVIFRARKGDSLPPALESEFDSNPNPTEGRFNKEKESIFYGAFEVETCLHEIRVALTDYVALATFKVRKYIRLLDVTDIAEFSGNPYDSIGSFIQKIVYSGEAEYPLCQELASEIKYRGYDGLISFSFFKQAHKKDLKNIILFGQPAKDGKITMISTNKINLKFVSYDFSYGPMRDNKKLDFKAVKLLTEEFNKSLDLLKSGGLEFEDLGKISESYLNGLKNIIDNS
jgi:hypothetical protein